MTSKWCPDLSGDPAVNLVGLAHDKFMNLGTATYNWAVTNLDGLNNIILEPYEFNVDFTFADPQASYIRPQRPTIDMGMLEFRDPGVTIVAAPTYTAGAVTIDEAPDFDAPPPVMVLGVRPDSPFIPLPIAPGDVVDIVMPVAPDYVLPPVPTFIELNLPAVPNIVMPEFTAVRPVLVDPPFNQDWTFEATPYTRVLVDTLVTTLTPMIVGSEALPQIIERAMFERGRSRIEVEANRSVEQAHAEFASRGFSQPPGQLAGAVLELRQAAQNSVAETSRDVAIKQFEESLASQRFAITAGAALEGTLISLHMEEQRYALEAAKFQMDSALSVVNFRVTVFNAQMQGYQTDAAVLRDRIQAELAKIEVFRAQLDGERLRGELNTQRVQLYDAQLRAIGTIADFYKTKVETVKVQADINMQGIEKYKAELSAYSERWRAYVSEWQGYSASVEGESKKVDIYRALVDSNAKRVDAWATKSGFAIEQERLRMQHHGINVEVWQSSLERLRALLGAEQARLAAVATGVDAQARLYTADASVESAASAAADRSFELGLSRERADVETQLKEVELSINQAQFLLAQAVEIQKAKAQISGQLAASTMSAVSYGASLSSSKSKGSSCSTNFSFQGEIIDA